MAEWIPAATGMNRNPQSSSLQLTMEIQEHYNHTEEQCLPYSPR